jgi:hypothetical protein
MVAQGGRSDSRMVEFSAEARAERRWAVGFGAGADGEIRISTSDLLCHAKNSYARTCTMSSVAAHVFVVNQYEPSAVKACRASRWIPRQAEGSSMPIEMSDQRHAQKGAANRAD